MEDNFEITYSASNKKKIAAGEFEATLYEPLNNVVEDIMGLVMERISLKKLTGLSITIKKI